MENNNPLLSVIIPVYNSEKVLRHCVKSILNQSFKDFELILVNDGSSDDSLKVCSRLSSTDNRVVVINKNNEGRVCARRDGFIKAKGKYITFVDHDDYLPLNAFSLLCGLAQEHDLDMVVGNYERVFDNWRLIKRKSGAFKNTEKLIEKDGVYDALYGTDINHRDDCADLPWGRLYRKSCILAAVDDDIESVFPSLTKNKPNEDYFFNLAVIPHISRLWLTNCIVYHWRYGGSSRVNHFYPTITKGGDYFDMRYHHFNEVGFQEGHARTFFKYLVCFYQELHQRIHLGISNEEEIRQIITYELNNREICKWAINNLDEEYRFMPRAKAVVNKDINAILMEAEKQYLGVKRHYKLSKYIDCYQWIADSLANFL